VKSVGNVVPFPLTRRRQLIVNMAQRMAPKAREHCINRTAQSLLRYGIDPIAVDTQIKQLRTAVALRKPAAIPGRIWRDRKTTQTPAPQASRG
jgi:hypothetical protein